MMMSKIYTQKLTYFSRRYFPRRVIPTKNDQSSLIDIKIKKDENLFKESLKEEDDLNDFLDSALYQ